MDYFGTLREVAARLGLEITMDLYNVKEQRTTTADPNPANKFHATRLREKLDEAGTVVIELQGHASRWNFNLSTLERDVTSLRVGVYQLENLPRFNDYRIRRLDQRIDCLWVEAQSLLELQPVNFVNVTVLNTPEEVTNRMAETTQRIQGLWSISEPTWKSQELPESPRGHQAHGPAHRRLAQSAQQTAGSWPPAPRLHSLREPPGGTQQATEDDQQIVETPKRVRFDLSLNQFYGDNSSADTVSTSKSTRTEYIGGCYRLYPATNGSRATCSSLYRERFVLENSGGAKQASSQPVPGLRHRR
ncbi:hypothetical protein IWX49DRAFT_557529 [Phyllosticta citricarpa]|uniref:Uncharacterized protein n=1 Tax=Phyllosticta citricarpa TaxID=55181 RepID=A0ABR1LRZ0_9PEZI